MPTQEANGWCACANCCTGVRVRVRVPVFRCPLATRAGDKGGLWRYDPGCDLAGPVFLARGPAKILLVDTQAEPRCPRSDGPADSAWASARHTRERVVSEVALREHGWPTCLSPL